MNIELRNIRHAVSMSQETPCYSATVFVDGKPAVDVGNSGRGGADQQRLRPGTTVSIADLDAFIAREMPAIDMSKHGMEPIPCNLELWCHRQVDEVGHRAAFQRHLRAKIVYVQDGALREFGFKRVRKLEQRHFDHVQQKYPEIAPLNLLPFEEAWAIARPLYVQD